MSVRESWFGKRWLAFLALGLLAVALGTPLMLGLVRGETDFQKKELHMVQLALISMMADNNLAEIPNPVATATNDMTAFPDATTAIAAKGLTPGDKAGYVLYGHDKVPDGQAEPSVNYVTFTKTLWTYTATSDGTLAQGEKAGR